MVSRLNSLLPTKVKECNPHDELIEEGKTTPHTSSLMISIQDLDQKHQTSKSRITLSEARESPYNIDNIEK